MEIPKQNLQEFLKENSGYKIIKRCKDTTLIRLPNKDLLKILDTELLMYLSDTDYDLETRLKEVPKLTSFTNFPWPTKMLEDNGVVTSYVMPYIEGIDFTDYYKNTLDLYSYARTHHQIENNIKAGNNVGIVFPDLCTTENIRITPDDKVYFIDYDGLQIKQMPAVGYSDFLGLPNEVLTKKYYDAENDLFTKELDIKSSIFLYFVDVFGVNLSSVNKINPYTGQKVTLDDVFELINLTDDDFKQKVWLLFQDKLPNEFLGDLLDKLAENYRLIMPNTLIKTLIKK